MAAVARGRDAAGREIQPLLLADAILEVAEQLPEGGVAAEAVRDAVVGEPEAALRVGQPQGDGNDRRALRLDDEVELGPLDEAGGAEGVGEVELPVAVPAPAVRTLRV